MTAPQKTAGIPNYGFVQSPVTSPQPNAIPVNVQWNANPMANGQNGAPGSPTWNYSCPPPQIIVPNSAYQWNIQPSPPGFGSTAVVPQNPQLGAAHQTFLKGKPYALGIVLIVTAIFQIILGIVLPFYLVSYSFYSGACYWGPLFYIAAGSLSISAYKEPSVCKVQGSLALNIIACICSVFGMVMNILDFSLVYDYCYDYYHGQCWEHGENRISLSALIFIMNVLVFCVSIPVSVFGCRALKLAPANAPPQILVIQNVPTQTLPAMPTEVPSSAPPAYAQ